MHGAGLAHAPTIVWCDLFITPPLLCQSCHHDVQAQLLPLCGGADLAGGQLPLMASMRKFLVKASGISEPDRTAAITTATKLAEMVARLACCCASTAPGSQAGVLLQHTAAQLLPAFQVGCNSSLHSTPLYLACFSCISLLVLLFTFPVHHRVRCRSHTLVCLCCHAACADAPLCFRCSVRLCSRQACPLHPPPTLTPAAA